MKKNRFHFDADHEAPSGSRDPFVSGPGSLVGRRDHRALSAPLPARAHTRTLSQAARTTRPSSPGLPSSP